MSKKIKKNNNKKSKKTLGVAASKMPKLGEHGLRAFRLGEHLPSIPQMVEELQDMWDVLLGRVDPPSAVKDSRLALMEVADAYYARASEMAALIQKAEREGAVVKGSAHYKFRTGELRTFMDVARRSADLGSRRLTHDALMFDKAKYGRESFGDDG